VVSAMTRYIYDGSRVIQERDGSNNPLVSYTRGSDLSGSLEGAGGIGGLLARSDGYSGGNWTSHNYYFADGNGNVTYMINSSQAMVASYRYDPYGNTISSSGSLSAANVYRFSSKETHVNSGMYYYLYRFYDPNLQRWINRDPIEELGGINLYSLAANDPADNTDALGLLPDAPGIPPWRGLPIPPYPAPKRPRPKPPAPPPARPPDTLYLPGMGRGGLPNCNSLPTDISGPAGNVHIYDDPQYHAPSYPFKLQFPTNVPTWTNLPPGTNGPR